MKGKTKKWLLGTALFAGLLLSPVGAKQADAADSWYWNGDYWTYVNEQGNYLFGWQAIGNTWYYFDAGTGKMHTGWLQLGDAWYYLQDSGIMATGTLTIGGTVYNFDASGKWIENPSPVVKKGWQSEGGQWYFYDNGQKQFGWLHDGNSWYFLNTASGAMQNGWQTISGNRYFFNPSGVMQTGWLNDGGTWYYLLADGSMVTGDYTIDGQTQRFDASGKWTGPVASDGWKNESGTWYYYKNGTKQTGWQNVNGAWYFMDTQGAMQNGWQAITGAWYFFNASGAMQTGWLNDGGSWYFLSANGSMVTGDYTINGQNERFDASGKWLGPTVNEGWKNENGNWYYYKNNIKQTGWQLVNNVWYYMNPQGVMQTGWLQLGNDKFYLRTDGSMVTGSYTIAGVVYNFDISGRLIQNPVVKNGWSLENGTWYYYKNSQKQTGWLQDGGTWYFLNTQGAMQTGWQWITNNWYYFNASGAMQTGWLQLGNDKYYLRTDGAMVTGSYTIAGIVYNFDASGRLIGNTPSGNRTYTNAVYGGSKITNAGIAKEFINVINEYRAQNGLTTLPFNQEVADIANEWALSDTKEASPLSWQPFHSWAGDGALLFTNDSSGKSDRQIAEDALQYLLKNNPNGGYEAVLLDKGNIGIGTSVYVKKYTASDYGFMIIVEFKNPAKPNNRPIG